MRLHIPEIRGLRQEVPAAVAPMTDRDMFSLLARSQPPQQPPQSQVGEIPAMANVISNATAQQEDGCGTSSLYQGGASSATPGLVSGGAWPCILSQAEPGMLMKTMQALAAELPKLELGDISTSANQSLSLRVAA